MKLAVISDIHSNLTALQAVLARIRELDVTSIYCLGDIVGYGPHPNECIELVRASCSGVVKGNHDSGTIGETPLEYFNPYGRTAIEWTMEQLTPANKEYLRGLPLVQTVSDCTITHASPVNPGAWTYVLTLSDAMSCFDAFETTICFIGHTHLPMIIAEDFSVNRFSKGKRHLINVGSVGQPRDHNPRSSFGFLDTEEGRYMLHRVAYDTRETARAIRNAGLPSYLGKRLQRGV